jgi:hypothetical protein
MLRMYVSKQGIELNFYTYIKARLSKLMSSRQQFFILLRRWGQTESTWYAQAITGPFVPALDNWWVWCSWWNKNWQGKPKYSDKNWPSATLFTQIPYDLTWYRTHQIVTYRSHQFINLLLIFLDNNLILCSKWRRVARIMLRAFYSQRNNLR